VHFFVSAVTVYGQLVVFGLCQWSLFWFVPCFGLYLDSTIDWNISEQKYYSMLTFITYMYKKINTVTMVLSENLWHLQSDKYKLSWLVMTNPYLENCTLLGYCAVSSSHFWLTFQDNLSVPSSGVKNPLISVVIPMCAQLVFF
jgi:hypothetical protein